MHLSDYYWTHSAADEGLACAAVVFGGVNTAVVVAGTVGVVGGVTTGVVVAGTVGVDGATVVVCCEGLACKSLALH